MAAYAPRDSTRWGRPVQVETVAGLTGCDTPAGKGVLAWRSGMAIHVAVLPSVREFVEDAVVTLGDVRSALDFSGSYALAAPTLSRIGNRLFLAIARLTAGTGYVELYEANNVENPTSWTLAATLQALGGMTTADGIVTPISTGKLFAMTSGRWVYQGGVWRSFLTISYQRSGCWHSDNAGASWTLDVDAGYYIVGGSFLLHHSNGVELDPITGKLFWTGYGSVSGAGFWTSTDGASWSQEVMFEIDGIRTVPIANNGSSAFVMRINSAAQILRLETAAGSHSFYGQMTPVASWLPPGETESAGDQVQMMEKAFVDAAGLTAYFYRDDRVAMPPPGGFLVGAVAAGG